MPPNKRIHLEIKRQVTHGLMPSAADILSYVSIRSPLLLSYCHTQCANMDVINNFFGKIYGRLNLICKLTQIYKTGISAIHKPDQVVAEMGHHKVYAVTSAENGKTHTILTCVSTAGYVLLPMMIFPRKQKPPANFREGAVAQTLFCDSPSGRIFLEFFSGKYSTNLASVAYHGWAWNSHVNIELIE